MSDRTRKVIFMVGFVAVLGGIAGVLCPFVGQWMSRRGFVHDIGDYRAEAEAFSGAKSRRLLDAAHAYNEELFARTGGAICNLSEEELEAYQAQLAMSADAIMGYIDIPEIGASLPIYHGTSEDVLQEGIGHLEGSSLPVGGESTHAVLAGHSGLPSKKIFTDLDQLDVGDTFTVTVLNTVLTYEVDDISVKLPEDVALTIREGSDECTLITCTPVGTNTHRLTVHAHRVLDTEEAKAWSDPNRIRGTKK